jgi:hypothetical protein
MDEATFTIELARYQEAADEATRARNTAGLLEIARATAVAEAADALIGQINPRTTKPHTWTSAESFVRDRPEHRQKQEAIIDKNAEAGYAEAQARALWLALRWAIAGREEGAVSHG